MYYVIDIYGEMVKWSHSCYRSVCPGCGDAKCGLWGFSFGNQDRNLMVHRIEKMFSSLATQFANLHLTVHKKACTDLEDLK